LRNRTVAFYFAICKYSHQKIIVVSMIHLCTISCFMTICLEQK
jgi:hypothetical protein